MRILLVERNVEQGCLNTLRDSSVVSDLRICSQVEEAREAIITATEDFDLAAIDQDLQGMSGLEFCLLKPTTEDQFSALPIALQEIARHHRGRQAREEAAKELRDQWKAFSAKQRPVLADFIVNAASEDEIANSV